MDDWTLTLQLALDKLLRQSARKWTMMGDLTQPVLAAGAIPFGGSGGVWTYNTSFLFGDATNKRLGIGTANPISGIHLQGTNPYFTIDHNNGTVQAYFQAQATLVAFGSLTNHPIYIITNSAAQSVFDQYANFYPATDLVGQLGATSNRWNMIFGKAIQVFQTGALTIGSVGSLVTPVNEGSTVSVLTDGLAGNLDGCIGGLYDSTGTLYKIGIRLNGAWKHVAVAGFSIPNYSKQKHTDGSVGIDETICPLCHVQMKPKEALGMYADKWDNGKDSKDGLHAVAAHMRCLRRIEDD